MQNEKLKLKNHREAASDGAKRYLNFDFCFLNSEFKNGFTLLEMIVSIGIFSVLVVTAIGITIGISNAQIKAANIQAIQDNMRFSLELITKEMRTGYAYALTGHGAACGGGSEVSFLTSLGEQRVYYLNTSTQTIMRITGSTNCANAKPFTADEVRVDQLTFQLRGHGAGPTDGQPMATIAMQIRSRSPKYVLESNMNLQTTIMQRLRDL